MIYLIAPLAIAGYRITATPANQRALITNRTAHARS